MGKIRQLDDKTVPLIAAGEVITTPESVIKELIENAIDAGATDINIELKGDGLELIRVTDNGVGMDLEDLKRCFLPHTTSKIRSFADISTVKTLGFRGEALASIALVSRLNIKSRTKAGSVGHAIHILYGEQGNIKSCAMQQGTSVEVTGLFERLPVRKQHLRRMGIRSGPAGIIRNYIFQDNNIGYTYSLNGKQLYRAPRGRTVASNLRSLFGTRYATDYIQLEGKLQRPVEFKYELLIFKPSIASSKSAIQLTYVNSRPVNYKALNDTLKHAYSKFSEPGTSPTFIAYIQTPHSNTDPNVHPSKHTIDIYNGEYLLQNIANLVNKTLNERNNVYTYSDISGDPPTAMGFQYSVLKDSSTNWNLKSVESDITSGIISQVDNTYLAVSTQAGLLVIDQHAAHEAVLYREYVAKYKDQLCNLAEIKQLNLLKPVVVSLLDFSAVIKQKITKLLTSIGFHITMHKNGTISVSKIPEIFKDHDIFQLVNDLVGELVSHTEVTPKYANNTRTYYEPEEDVHLDTQTKRTLEFLSCRGAVKAGQPLTADERLNLVKRITSEEYDIYLCPHGRPVKILIKTDDLAKMFKRK